MNADIHFMLARFIVIRCIDTNRKLIIEEAYELKDTGGMLYKVRYDEAASIQIGEVYYDLTGHAFRVKAIGMLDGRSIEDLIIDSSRIISFEKLEGVDISRTILFWEL